MAYDIECPYCGHEQDICHDDGFGYEEGVRHELECHGCGKSYVFETSISFYYEPYPAECLNGEPHEYKPTHTFPRKYSKMSCCNCDHERELTDEEFKLHWPNEER